MGACYNRLMNQVLREKKYPSGYIFQIVQGDLTQEPVEAIVNAANSGLQHGGGVAGVIVRKGGVSIQNESDHWVNEHGPVSHSNPAYTSAGNLPFKYIIHAVGPVWGSGEEDAKLMDAILGSLGVADELGLQSVAFPAISTGIFGFPKDRAARLFYKLIDDYFTVKSETKLNLIRLTLFDKSTLKIFLHVWDTRSE